VDYSDWQSKNNSPSVLSYNSYSSNSASSVSIGGGGGASLTSVTGGGGGYGGGTMYAANTYGNGTATDGSYGGTGTPSITVNVNPRDGFFDLSSSNSGHAWVTITNNDGTSVIIGNYPGGPRDDSDGIPTASYTWTINQNQADAARMAIKQPGYKFFSDNCVDRVGKALDVSRIQHPNFNTLGISDPNKVYTWINNLNSSNKSGKNK
jgi:hypothetical protein